MVCRLIALDKMPCIRPVGIGDSWRRLLAKCLLRVTGEEAKIACGSSQLCRGIHAGIEAGSYAMRMQWDADNTLEDQGFLACGREKRVQLTKPCDDSLGGAAPLALRRHVHVQLL